MLELAKSLRPELRAIISPAPRIYILARPAFLGDNFRAFLKQHGLAWVHDTSSTSAELLAEAAGRVCYMSFGEKQHRKSSTKYFENIIESGHESVVEHGTWTFLIEGISRAFTHQLVRHRVGFSFSQLSQQYCDSEDALFVAPIEVQQNIDLLRDWAQTMFEVREQYRRLKSALSRSRSFANRKLTERERLRALRSASRSILPNCTETKIVVSANARALRHFLALRGNIPGDLEMGAISVQLLELMNREAPKLFFDFEFRESENGIRNVKKRRVKKVRR